MRRCEQSACVCVKLVQTVASFFPSTHPASLLSQMAASPFAVEHPLYRSPSTSASTSSPWTDALHAGEASRDAQRLHDTKRRVRVHIDTHGDAAWRSAVHQPTPLGPARGLARRRAPTSRCGSWRRRAPCRARRRRSTCARRPAGLCRRASTCTPAWRGGRPRSPPALASRRTSRRLHGPLPPPRRRRRRRRRGPAWCSTPRATCSTLARATRWPRRWGAPT